MLLPIFQREGSHGKIRRQNSRLLWFTYFLTMTSTASRVLSELDDTSFTSPLSYASSKGCGLPSSTSGTPQTCLAWSFAD